MASITVGVCLADDLPSHLIAWFGGGGWSHVTSLLPDREHVIDARVGRIGDIPPGVQVRPVSYLKKDKVLWLDVPCTQKQKSAYYAGLEARVGDGYSVSGILSFLTGRFRTHDWRTAKDLFCSELGTVDLQESGICPKFEINPSRITPGDFLLIVCALGAVPSQFKG